MEAVGRSDGGCRLNISGVVGHFFEKKSREMVIWDQRVLFYHVSSSFLDNGLIPFNPAAVAKIFNPIAELVIFMGTPSRKAKVEIEINPVTAEAKTRNCLI